MPSAPDKKKLKESGMDAAFNPPTPHPGEAIMNAIAGLMGGSKPAPSPSPTESPQCPNCGHTLGEQINYPQGSS